MFYIGLLGKLDDATGKPLAKVIFGNEEEVFPLFSDCWSEKKFEAQWLDALTKLSSAKGNARTALVTEIYTPNVNQAIRWWLLYREGQDLWIREQLVTRDQFPENFDPMAAGNFVPPRSKHDANNDGFVVSEWHVSMEDLAKFLASLKIRVGNP
ncbi:MAG TPA: hypothetical protein PLQ67_02145 [Burkholderiaceae bacterium]|nr:hypothetical protein [Burkholderiaceae bacterium]